MYYQRGPGSSSGGWLLPALLAVALVIIAAFGATVLLTRHQRGDGIHDTSAMVHVNAAPRPPAIPPLVQGLDSFGETCNRGFSHPNATGFGSRTGRGTLDTPCFFAFNVLKAYWQQYGTPTRQPRTVTAQGGVACTSTAGPCDGANFIMNCTALGSDDWITCTGAGRAKVYLY